MASFEELSKLPPAELVGWFIKLRDAKRAAEAEFKQSMERTNQGLEKLEGILLARLEELGADSLSCEEGTVYRHRKDSATVQEPQVFREWLLQTGQWDAADIKANKTVMRDLFESGEQVPGVKFSSIQTVGVRRS